MEFVSIKNLPKAVRLAILKQLGYGSDGQFVTDEQGKRIRDRYVDVEISLSNMLIFPGSTIILDNNYLSVAAYLEEHEDAF
ncbi:MAG: hypothetical protein AABW54_05090 [Candidatus Micrarchaeota archaeon]